MDNWTDQKVVTFLHTIFHICIAKQNKSNMTLKAWLKEDSPDSSHPSPLPTAPGRLLCGRCAQPGAAACACECCSSLSWGARWWSSWPLSAARRGPPGPGGFPACCSWWWGRWAPPGERPLPPSVRTEPHSARRFHFRCSVKTDIENSSFQKFSLTSNFKLNSLKPDMLWKYEFIDFDKYSS